MRPLLYVAGLAMDNSLIYGEWLGLTGLLYQFWTIMRSLANFVIVFLLVWTIGKQMRDWAKWAKELGKTIMAIMVSGIVINASWFLIGAMVDLSTIATYGVWTIPLKLSGWDDAYCKTTNGITKVENPVKDMKDIAKLWTCRPILATHGTMNLSDTFSAEAAQRKVYYSYEATTVNPWTHYFLSCPFKNGSITTSGWNDFLTSFTSSGTYALTNWVTGTIAGDQKVKDYLRKSGSMGSTHCVVWTNQIMQVPKNGKIDLYGSWYYESVIWWVQTLHSWWWLRIRNLVETNKGMIGVMYTMYGNMLWFANIKTDVQTNSTESQIIQFLVKWFFGFAIMFPLIALCIVLMMRVAVLWMVVWFAPLLVLWWTLELMGIKNEQLSSMMKWIWEKLTLSNVVNLLFQPVLVVFVITMGMMFLDALQATIVADNGFWEALKCDNSTWQQCCSMIDVVNICFEKFNAQAGTDAFFNYFTFTIVNIVGVMLLWFMVFAVMKSSKITEWAVSKIQWLGRNVLWSIPVIPWFDGSFVWFDGAKDGLGKAFDTVTEGTKDKTGETITKPWVDKTFEDLSGAAGTAKKKMKESLPDIKPDDIIKDSAKTQEFTGELLKSIDSAKWDVKYSTADNLVDVSDPRIDALFKKYNISDKKLENLLTNPEFMVDAKMQDSKKGRDIFKTKWWDKTKYADLWKEKYLDALKAQSSKIQSVWSANKWYYKTSSGSRILLEKIEKKNDSWTITDIEIKPLNISIKDKPLLWKYSYDDVKDLSGKLTGEELEAFTGLSKGVIEKETKDKEWREILENTTNKELMDIKQRSKLPA
jgi:hypothetical protein